MTELASTNIELKSELRLTHLLDEIETSCKVVFECAAKAKKVQKVKKFAQSKALITETKNYVQDTDLED